MAAMASRRIGRLAGVTAGCCAETAAAAATRIEVKSACFIDHLYPQERTQGPRVSSSPVLPSETRDLGSGTPGPRSLASLGMTIVTASSCQPAAAALPGAASRGAVHPAAAHPE